MNLSGYKVTELEKCDYLRSLTMIIIQLEEYNKVSYSACIPDDIQAFLVWSL